MIDRLFPGAAWFEWHWFFWPLIALILRLVLLELVSSDALWWRGVHRREPLRDVKAEQVWTESQFWHKLALATILGMLTYIGWAALRTPPRLPLISASPVQLAITKVLIAISIIFVMDAVQTIINRGRTKDADNERTFNQQRRRGDMHHVEIIAEQLEQKDKA